MSVGNPECVDLAWTMCCFCTKMDAPCVVVVAAIFCLWLPNALCCLYYDYMFSTVVIPPYVIQCLETSPDGSFDVITCDDGLATKWEEEGNRIHTIKLHANLIHGCKNTITSKSNTTSTRCKRQNRDTVGICIGRSLQRTNRKTSSKLRR